MNTKVIEVRGHQFSMENAMIYAVQSSQSHRAIKMDKWRHLWQKFPLQSRVGNTTQQRLSVGKMVQHASTNLHFFATDSEPILQHQLNPTLAMCEQMFTNDLKTLGLLFVTEENAATLNDRRFDAYIKVLFLTAGAELKIDLAHYSVSRPSLYFISPDQYLDVKKTGSGQGYFIFYNRDFYCIQIHDDEVACDGLLFNNVHNVPMVVLEESEVHLFTTLFGQMLDEFALQDASLEEMIRTYLKQLFIKAARLWKKQNFGKGFTRKNSDVEFFRKFTMLVEQHYKQKHNVSDYADLLFVAPKTIAHKFRKLDLPPPNDVIKNRIVLEAKRLLVHTALSAKEVGYKLGYDDPAYFSRLFVQKTGQTASGFRSKFLADVNS